MKRHASIVVAGMVCVLSAQIGSAPSAAARLTAGSAQASAKIAFVSDNARQAAPEPFQDYDLWVMASDGSGKRQLTHQASIGIDGGAWSPGGRRIAFTSYERQGANVNGPSIHVMNADGSGQRRLARGSNPAWSPDGRKLAFARSRGAGFDIYVMNADGSGRQNLTQRLGIDVGVRGLGHGWGSFFSWSPDGRMIAFTGDHRRDGWEIYVVNLDGSGLRNLTRRPGDDHVGAWSRDGRQIAFTSDRDGNWEVYVMHADGSGQRRLTRNPGNDAVPAWSAGGQEIGFVSVRSSGSDVYVMSSDGRGARNVSRTPGVGEFVWSPDGRRIAFEAGDIYVVNADGGSRRNLTRTPRYREIGVAWAPVPSN